jgi:hypothetical protein
MGMKTPEGLEGGLRYSTYEILVLVAGRITAFAGIATSEVVLRNEKKEWFPRKASVLWSRRSATGGIITSTGVLAPWGN